MKHKLLNKLLFLTLLTWGGVIINPAWAGTYEYTFTSNAWTSNGSTTLNGVSWTLNMDGGTISSYDATSGMHFGTNKSTCNSVSISTSGIDGTITAVTVRASRGSSLVGNLSVKVGSTTFKCNNESSVGLTTTTTDYEFTGSESGTIDIKWTKSSGNGAFWIKYISVTYTSGFTVTYDANGATGGSVPTDNIAYSSGATVTVKGNTGDLVRAGYTFGGWNTQADGNGTNYTAGTGTFSITANTTLYAKWNAKTITGLSYTGTPSKTSYYAGENFDPTGLTVIASFDDSSSETVTPSVVWTPSPLTTGTTSVTGTYMEQTVNVTGLTVIAAPGSAENPYTVAQARAAIDAGTGTTNVYATGVVSQAGTVSSGQISYYISADGLTTSDQLQAYKGKGIGGVDFESNDDIQVGDVVVIYGNLKKYNSIYEFDQNNQLVSLVRQVATPTFSPAAGAVASGTEITISCATDGATIYYTTDGSTPTTSSTAYNPASKPTVTAATTFKAYAVKDGCTDSEVAEAAYTISVPTATPTISLATGTYTSAQSVTITCGTAGATIYYTTDGTDPTTSSAEYTTAITIDESCTLKAIAVADGYAPSAVASAEYTMQIPTLAVSPTTATEFTYNEGEGPSATQTFTLSGEYLTAAITVSVPAEGSFEISSDGTTFSNSLSLGDDDTFDVRMKAGLSAGDYDGTVTISSTGAENVTIDLTGTVAGANVTWDLTTSDYSSASTTEVSWTSSQATMTLAKGSSSTNANNYLGGSGSYTHTRFYQNQVLTIAPASGYQILSAEITAVSGNAAGFTGNSWTNALASTSSTTVTVTPTDGSQEMSVTISGACRATAVTVYYSTNTTPSIAVNTTLNVDCGEADGTIDVTYNNIADNSSAEVILCDSEGEATTYDWIDVELDGNKDVYYVIAANTGAERTGYLKVKVGGVTSEIVTITQAEYVVQNTYTLATAITSGKHYVIASEDGMVMAEQKTNNRNAVQATLSSNTLTFASNAGVHEVIIYGPDKDNLYTIYDETDNGYLYAASSSANNLKTQATINDNSRWAIEFSGSVASIVATQSSNRNVMQFNSNLFSCYASDSQSDVYLYEKSGEAAPTESVTLNAYGYATYCSQNALDFTSAGVTAWAITAANSTSGVITFSQITGKVPAGTGMLLKGSGTVTLTSASGEVSALSSNLLVGTTADFEVENDGDYYGLKGNTFVPVTAGTVPAGKALLPASALGNNVKAFTFVFEDDATAIKDLNDLKDSKDLNDVIYNLAGQRMNKMQKGINIVNGKKIMY